MTDQIKFISSKAAFRIAGSHVSGSMAVNKHVMEQTDLLVLYVITIPQIHVPSIANCMQEAGNKQQTLDTAEATVSSPLDAIAATAEIKKHSIEIIPNDPCVKRNDERFSEHYNNC